MCTDTERILKNLSMKKYDDLTDSIFQDPILVFDKKSLESPTLLTTLPSKSVEDKALAITKSIHLYVVTVRCGSPCHTPFLHASVWLLMMTSQVWFQSVVWLLMMTSQVWFESVVYSHQYGFRPLFSSLLVFFNFFFSLQHLLGIHRLSWTDRPCHTMFDSHRKF